MDVSRRPLVILVCGGREFSNRDWMWRVLESYRDRFGVLVHGDGPGTKGKPGADKLADEWARRNLIPIRPFPADWNRYGHPAGPIRNSLMLKEGKPDLVLAFPGGRGTKDMVDKALAAGVEVRQWHREPEDA